MDEKTVPLVIYADDGTKTVIGEVKLTDTPDGLYAETRITNTEYYDKFIKSVMKPGAISIDREAFREERDGTTSGG
jgi:hypothetical protein